MQTMTTSLEIGQRIRARRASLAMSRALLAILSGLTLAEIDAMEDGTRVYGEAVDAVAVALEMGGRTLMPHRLPVTAHAFFSRSGEAAFGSRWYTNELGENVLTTITLPQRSYVRAYAFEDAEYCGTVCEYVREHKQGKFTQTR